MPGGNQRGTQADRGETLPTPGGRGTASARRHRSPALAPPRCKQRRGERTATVARCVQARLDRRDRPIVDAEGRKSLLLGPPHGADLEATTGNSQQTTSA